MEKLPFFGRDEGQPGFARLCISDRRYNSFRAGFFSRIYMAGQCVHRQGEEISHFGIVTSGVLKAVSYTGEGQELCNAYFEEEDSFPELLYLTGKRRYTYQMYAEKKASVLWIPIPLLEEMLTEDPRLMSALLLYVSQRGLKNQMYLNCLNYHSIRQRIAYWAVGIQKIEGMEKIRMPLSQTIFANLLHVSRSSLNQELKLMEREGFFRILDGKMEILDKEQLELLL